MKMKLSYRVGIGVGLVMALLVVFFLNTPRADNLFSRSVDTVDTATGEDPKPVVESLDTKDADTVEPLDREALLQELQRQLLQTQNDPDKALKIRRQIQALQVENKITTDTSVENNS